jgi:hypothetical protein
MENRTRSRWPLVCTFCLIGSLASAALAQQEPAMRITIDLQDAQKAANWPGVVTGVTIAGRSIRLGQPITVTDKWLGTMVVTLRNISPKAIVQLGMYLTFPESGNGSEENPYEAVWTSLGIVPKVVYTDRNGHYHPPPSFGAEPAPLRVPPGGMIRVSFSKNGDSVQAKLAEKHVAITKATLGFMTIYFADDSRWSAGTYLLPPSPVPGAWTIVTKEEFFRGAGTAR